MFPPQPIQVTCPQCNQPFTALVQNIIDVGARPELKEQFLRGRLNLAGCPHCGFAAGIGAPLLYHDPDKELALVLMPTELNLPRNDEEKLIGSLTNALIDSLPPEKRKGYLFRPKTFLSLEGLIKAILEADGITAEMMEAQEKRVGLIQDLSSRLDNEEQFQAFVEEHQSEIDYELFLILRAMIDSTRRDGLGEEAQSLEKLRHRLLEATGGPAGAPPGQVEVKTFDELLDVLLGAESQEELQAMVATNRAVFDYGFFQQITNHIQTAQQAGDSDRAGELLQLRQNVLAAAETVDRATEAALQNAAQRLQDILSADDPHTAVQERLEEIDEAFLVVLAANVAQAEEQGHKEIAGTLRNLYDFTLERLEEQMPPQARTINRLLRTETAAERRSVLQEAGDVINNELLQTLEAVADDAKAQGQQQLVSEFDEIIQLVKEHVKEGHDD
ncbi:MAG: CpXC domain-containing protein [Anaerolineae bacterium]